MWQFWEKIHKNKQIHVIQARRQLIYCVTNSLSSGIFGSDAPPNSNLVHIMYTNDKMKTIVILKIEVVDFGACGSLNGDYSWMTSSLSLSRSFVQELP